MTNNPQQRHKSRAASRSPKACSPSSCVVGIGGEPDEVTPTSKSAKWLMNIGGIGLLISLYLIKEHYSDEGSICDLSSHFSCSLVNRSEYSVLFGVPVAFWGVIWNVQLSLMAKEIRRLLAQNVLRDQHAIRSYISFLFVWCLGGVGFVIYFLVAEYLLQAVCLFCTAIHALTLVAMYVSYGLFSAMGGRSPDPAELVNTLWVWLAGLGTSAAALFICFNFVFVPSESHSEFKSSVDAFRMAKCITRNGFVMFGSMKCGHCVLQKEHLGPAFEFIEFVECAETVKCAEDHNITHLPTWIQFAPDNPSAPAPGTPPGRRHVELERHGGALDPLGRANLTGCPLR